MAEQSIHIHHENNGACAECQVIFDRYTGFHKGLREWFVLRQKEQPQLHISGAGRGSEEQNRYCVTGRSDAHWGHSAHNYNAAIDLWFQVVPGVYSLPEAMFDRYVMTKLCSWMNWYGQPAVRRMSRAERKVAKKYYELPHVEVTAWRDMAKKGELTLVEEDPSVKLL